MDNKNNKIIITWDEIKKAKENKFDMVEYAFKCEIRILKVALVETKKWLKLIYKLIQD